MRVKRDDFLFWLHQGHAEVLGQGSNLCHSRDNTQCLTGCTTRQCSGKMIFNGGALQHLLARFPVSPCWGPGFKAASAQQWEPGQVPSSGLHPPSSPGLRSGSLGTDPPHRTPGLDPRRSCGNTHLTPCKHDILRLRNQWPMRADWASEREAGEGWRLAKARDCCCCGKMPDALGTKASEFGQGQAAP